MISNCHCISTVTIILLNISVRSCYVNYEIFKGFDIDDGRTTSNISSSAVTEANIISIVNEIDLTINNQTATSNTTVKPTKQKMVKIKCPEDERPMSLGTYEIPTQRDLMLFTKRTLTKMFNSYHQKTLFLLKDIKEVTKATESFEKKCVGRHKEAYKKCVTNVSKRCVAITKNLVAIMERQKLSVADLLEGKTCNMTVIKTDPIQLITSLAMDEASLEFALPAFLRLIGGCSAHCSKYLATGETIRRPSRHMTDQDLVIKHFLTSKNYIQLIKDSDTRVYRSKNAGLVNWMHSAHS